MASLTRTPASTPLRWTIGITTTTGILGLELTRFRDLLGGVFKPAKRATYPNNTGLRDPVLTNWNDNPTHRSSSTCWLLALAGSGCCPGDPPRQPELWFRKHRRSPPCSCS